MNESGKAVKTLPLMIAHAAILNPLYATEKMVSTSLFTKTQLERACSSLTAVLEKRYELTSPQDEGEDGVVECSGFACLMAPSTVQQSCDKAAAEVRRYVFGYKLDKNLPTFKKTPNTRYLHGIEADDISLASITIGDEIDKHGENLFKG